MKILIFTEGTALMHASAVGVSRDERVRQSAAGGIDIDDFASYEPNGKVVEKLTTWKKQGAQIYYLTSRTLPKEIAAVQSVLNKFQFPDKQNLLFRHENQSYKDVAEKLMPAVLIEDDCESIGGEKEMTFPHIMGELKSKIHSIVVKEFAGIDDLPDMLAELLAL